MSKKPSKQVHPLFIKEETFLEKRRSTNVEMWIEDLPGQMWCSKRAIEPKASFTLPRSFMGALPNGRGIISLFGSPHKGSTLFRQGSLKFSVFPWRMCVLLDTTWGAVSGANY